jgi:hypothetical protein
VGRVISVTVDREAVAAAHPAFEFDTHSPGFTLLPADGSFDTPA